MAGGAQLDYRTREGLTPLHKAAVCGQANSVKVTYLKMQIEYNKSSALNKALGDFDQLLDSPFNLPWIMLANHSENLALNQESLRALVSGFF